MSTGPPELSHSQQDLGTDVGVGVGVFVGVFVGVGVLVAVGPESGVGDVAGVAVP